MALIDFAKHISRNPNTVKPVNSLTDQALNNACKYFTAGAGIFASALLLTRSVKALFSKK